MLTILIPIDLERRSNELVERLNTLCLGIVNSSYSVVVGHADRGTKYDRKLLTLIKGFDNQRIRVVSDDSGGDLINLSRLRNLASSIVDTEYILLLDIDILLDISMIKLMLERIQSEKLSYVMAPCLYLTKYATQIIQKDEAKKNYIVNKYFNFSDKEVSHLAIPSSIILLRTQTYQKIGGFFEGYTGHGYEDFDFMIRLALYYQEIVYSKELFIDETYNAPLLSKGFRAELAQSCIFYVVQKKFFFHLYHKKIQSEEYYQSRKKNALLFKERLEIFFKKNYNRDNKGENCPRLLQRFFNDCSSQNMNYNVYLVLFQIKQKGTLKKNILKYLKKVLIHEKKI